MLRREHNRPQLDRSPWQERALSARTDRSTLTTYLANRTPSDRADLLEWLLTTAIRLPASLNPGFGEALDPALRNVDAILRGTVSELPPTTVAAILALPLFERIRQRFPGIRLQLFEGMSGYISEMLSNGRLDLALLFRDSETRGMSVIPVFDEELYVLGDAGLSLPENQTVCPLHLLSNVPLVAPSTSNGLRLIIERTFQREDVELNLVADIDSLPTLIAIAGTGEACTILPASALARQEPSTRPVMRRIVDPVMSRPASVCWSHALPISAAALAVRKSIVELIGELHAQGLWTGITLRPPPDAGTLADTGGAPGAQGFD